MFLLIAKLQYPRRSVIAGESNRKYVNYILPSLPIGTTSLELQILLKYALKNKGSDGFHRDAIEKTFFMVPQRTFQWSVLKRTICEEPFPTVKNLLWNKKFPWMLKILHETVNANKLKDLYSKECMSSEYVCCLTT